MSKNYLKTAWGNLWRNEVVSPINISGLTIGLATCLVITLFVKGELSYDHYNKNANRIYRVNASVRMNGRGFNSMRSPASLDPAMVKNCPHSQHMVRIYGIGSLRIEKETLMEPHSTFADSTLFDVFTFPMIAGNPQTALTQSYPLVLSERMAQKYFNTTDVIGKSLYI